MIRMAFFERANKSEFRFLPLYSDSTTFPEYIVSPGQVGVDSLARGLDFSLPPAPEDGRPQRGGHPAFLSGPSFVEVSLWRLGGLIRGLLPFRGRVCPSRSNMGLETASWRVSGDGPRERVVASEAREFGVALPSEDHIQRQGFGVLAIGPGGAA